MTWLTSRLPVLAQVVGALMVSGGVGAILGWAAACVICGTGIMAIGTLAERAKLLGKG